MAPLSKSEIVKALMKRYGQTYCEEIGIRLEDKPSPLFRWLVGSLLFSAPIGAPQAVDAARALSKAGWRTADKMSRATWKQRVDVLNANGYARYDESTSRMLKDTSDMLIYLYGGDLRRLRKAADGDVKKAEKLLTEFKGIGPTGAAIFLREVQSVWGEFYPFADPKAESAGGMLGLGQNARTLSKHVARKDFPALLAGLVRADLDGSMETLKAGEERRRQTESA